MDVTLGPRIGRRRAPDAVVADVTAALPAGDVVVACSGGVDSLTLAMIVSRGRPAVVAHAVSAAVPTVDTERVRRAAASYGWTLREVAAGEFDDEDYLRNPVDRCYHCKSHLYRALHAVEGLAPGGTVLSGANTDDLGEYRPGLVAAAEHDVRHPFVDAGVSKADVRRVARHLGLDAADLPASPCLASRLYTGTRVTPERLAAVEAGEAVLRDAGFPVVRCRIRGRDDRVDEVLVEVPDDLRMTVTAELLDAVAVAMRRCSDIAHVRIDDEGYRPGRSFVHGDTTGR